MIKTINRKLYFIADGHTSKLIYANRPLIKEDTYKAWYSIVDKILEEEVREKAVILCGDTFDTKRPSSEDVLVISRVVMKLRAKDIKVYGIDGNHDLCSPSWIENQGVIMLDNQVHNILGWNIGGFDFVAGKGIYNKLEEWNDRECDFLVMHQPLDHLSPFEPHTITMEDVPSGVNIGLVTGHVHINDIKQNGDNKWVVSPGAIHSRKLTHDRGTFVTYSDEFKFVKEDVPYSRDFYRCVIKDDESLERNLGDMLSLPDELDNDERPVIGIKFKIEYSATITQFIENNPNKGFYITTPISETKEEDLEIDEEIVNTSQILNKILESKELPKEEFFECLVSFIHNKDMSMFNDKIKQFKEERNAIN